MSIPHTLEALFIGTLHNQSGSFPLWVVGLAFLGGIISSILPCAIAMLPILIGYIGGYGGQSKGQVFIQVALFIVGVALTMTLLGILASVLGMTFGALIGPWWYVFMGIVALVMGCQLLEWIHLPMPSFIKQLPVLGQQETSPKWLKACAPIILGMAFGAASSPCGTPYLTAILGLMAYQQNWFLGGISLFAYAVGQGMLLLVIGLFTGFMKHLTTMRKVGFVLTTTSAIVFMIAGCILIAQGLGWLG